jgi:ABC-type transport system involved in cytochrome c biogenesis permease component
MLLLAVFPIPIPVLITSKGVVTNNEPLVCVCAALMFVITALITWVVIKAFRMAVEVF